jgi:hypothetical protein
MRVRFTTTAGRHSIGATFLATNYAPLLDLDRHFMRSTVQTGPTPGYTFFPHVGTLRIEGPVNATAAKDSPAGTASSSARRRAGHEAACAQRIGRTCHALRRPRNHVRRKCLRRSTPQDAEGTSTTVRAPRGSRLAAVHLPHRGRARGVKPGCGVSPERWTRRVLAFFLEHGADDASEVASSDGQRAGGAGQQVRRMLGPESRRPRRELRRPVAQPARSPESGRPLLYPDFDDPRGGLRREVELLFARSSAKTAASWTC